MKHSKFYLGITTAILTIAGMAATRVHRTTSVSTYYATKTPVATHCFPAADALYTANGTGPRGKYNPTVGGLIVGSYFIYTNSTCATPAKLRID